MSNQHYYGPHGPHGFGHGHINGDTGYHRPPVSNSSIEAALGWTAIHGAMGNGNIQHGKSLHNIGNPAANSGRQY